jgi:hypothetical protein
MKNNAKHLEVHVSGPFQNTKIGKSYWIVVFGNNGRMWLIKPEFVTGYLQCLLAEIETTNIDNGYCKNYYEINICQQEFGQDSIWKRVQKKNGRPPQTLKRLSFVYSCDTPEETIVKQRLNEALRFFCLSLKKRESNPVGPLILDHIRNHADWLYRSS